MILSTLVATTLLGACGPTGRWSGDATRVLVGERHFIEGYPALAGDSLVNVVVEIPAGTNEKWEVSKSTGHLEWELRDGQPRVVNYLSYPANYGMIPGTMLAKEAGGDGDPLDVMVLGPAMPRGTVVPCRLIGVLQLLDGGEADHKLLAVLPEGPFGAIQSMEMLEDRYPGALAIISLWFAHYKGPGETEILGMAEADKAWEILRTAAGTRANSR